MAFDIYKPSQGKYTRLGSAFAITVMLGIGCWRLYVLLANAFSGLSDQRQLLISTLIPAGLFVILGLLVYRLANKPVVADFMIAAEGEMKKVSWSSRRELAVSTFIVIVVVMIFAVLLGLADFLFELYFKWLLIG